MCARCQRRACLALCTPAQARPPTCAACACGDRPAGHVGQAVHLPGLAARREAHLLPLLLLCASRQHQHPGMLACRQLCPRCPAGLPCGHQVEPEFFSFVCSPNNPACRARCLDNCRCSAYRMPPGTPAWSASRCSWRPRLPAPCRLQSRELSAHGILLKGVRAGLHGRPQSSRGFPCPSCGKLASALSLSRSLAHHQLLPCPCHAAYPTAATRSSPPDSPTALVCKSRPERVMCPHTHAPVIHTPRQPSWLATIGPATPPHPRSLMIPSLVFFFNHASAEQPPPYKLGSTSLDTSSNFSLLPFISFFPSPHRVSLQGCWCTAARSVWNMSLHPDAWRWAGREEAYIKWESGVKRVQRQ